MLLCWRVIGISGAKDLGACRWVDDLDAKMKADNRHILLLADNFSGHKTEKSWANVQIKFFEPNLTAFVQPADAGVIRALKAHFRSKCVPLMLSHPYLRLTMCFKGSPPLSRSRGCRRRGYL
jgi:hypothetical protein